MEITDNVNLGPCDHCHQQVFNGGPWGEMHGLGNLYHASHGTLFCKFGTAYDANYKATLKGSHHAPESFGSIADDVTTLVVTFLDGTVVEYPGTRFQTELSKKDPIVINGTTVTIENYEQTTTLLGVRSFQMEF